MSSHHLTTYQQLHKIPERVAIYKHRTFLIATTNLLHCDRRLCEAKLQRVLERERKTGNGYLSPLGTILLKRVDVFLNLLPRGTGNRTQYLR